MKFIILYFNFKKWVKLLKTVWFEQETELNTI